MQDTLDDDVEPSPPSASSVPGSPTFIDHQATTIPSPLPPPQTQGMWTHSQKNIYKPKHLHTATKHLLADDVEPCTVQQALSIPHWRKAMNDGFTTLQRHGT